MPAVFVSHATADDAAVTQLHDDLERLTGVDIWVDHKDIKLGEPWDDRIASALYDCPYCIVVLSRQSYNRAEVKAEWRAALSYNHAVLPLLLDDLPYEDIPYRLRAQQHVSLEADWDAGVAQAAAAIKGTPVPGDGPAFSRWPILSREPLDRRLTAIPMAGRDDDLAHVKKLLAAGHPVAITGGGGLGKSRLAAELVLTLEGVGGAVWHVCSDVSRPDEVVELLRDHYGLPVDAERRATLDRLRTHRRLVVLDNAESVPANDPRRPDYVRLINEVCAAGAPLALTSRAMWGDVRLCREHTPTALSDAAAQQIVLDMAAALDVAGLEPLAGEIAAAARQHPRLIEWAVGQMKRFPPAKVIADLRDLTSRDVQAALDEMFHKTLRQMAAADADGAAAERALRRLAVCRGGFTYEAAAALDADPDDADARDAALAALQTWCFVTYDPPRRRYELAPLALAALPADPDARRPHFDYYEALARQHDERQDYAGLDAESANLEAAFEGALEAGEHEAAYWFCNACGDFLGNRGRFEQRRGWLERAAAALEQHPDDRLRASVQNSLGIVYQEQPTGDRRANLRRAVACYQAALVYCTPAAAPLDHAMTQNNLGTAYRDLAEIEERADNLRRAVACFQAALVYYTPAAAPRDHAMTQNNLGNAYGGLAEIEERADNLRRAVACYEAALVYRTPAAAPLGHAGTQHNLGAAYHELAKAEERADNLRRAVACYQAALVYRTPAVAPLAHAATQNNLGAAYRGLAGVEERADNLRRAVACYQAALVYLTAAAAPLGHAMTQHGLGIVYEDLGDLPAAIACWRAAEQHYRRVGADEKADLMLAWIADAEGRLG